MSAPDAASGPPEQPTIRASRPHVLPWQRTLAVGGVTFLLLMATAGLRPLFLPDEGRYVGVAREMLLSGDVLTPTLDGLPYFHKPPLFYWITAASMALFGVHEWAARLAPALGATLGAVSLHHFLYRWGSQRLADRALAALLVQPLWFIGSQFANMDMLVAGCVTAAIVLLADAARCAQASVAHRPALLVAWAAMGLGVLAKGLMGVVLPALVVGLWLLLDRARRPLWRALLWWPGPALAGAMAAPWFVAMAWRHPGFLEYVFLEQQMRRYVAGGFNNPQPWWFYVPVLLLFSGHGLEWLWRSCTRRLAEEAGTAGRSSTAPPTPQGPVANDGRTGPSPTAASSLPSASPATLSLLRLWVAMVVLFFSVPQSKLVGYVLPAVPALAALMAAGLERPGRPGRWRVRRWRVSLCVALAVSLGLTVGIAWQAPKSSRALGQTIREQRLPGQPVWLLGVYPFDLAFYAGLESPMPVVDRWADPGIARHDNWRKELADAQRFAPLGSSQVLVQEEAWRGLLCAHALSWVVGPGDAPQRWPVLQVSREVARGTGELRLWQVDLARPETVSRLGCTGPSHGPAPAATPRVSASVGTRHDARSSAH